MLNVISSGNVFKSMLGTIHSSKATVQKRPTFSVSFREDNSR